MVPKTPARTCIRTAAWVYALLALGLTLSTAGALATGDGESGWLPWGLGVLAVSVLVGILDAATTRIRLHGDAIEWTSGFRKTSVPRDSIQGVSWESGSGATVTLSDGRRFRLPETGHDAQGVANSVRGWLKRR